MYGIPLLTPAKSGRLRVQDRRRKAIEVIKKGMEHVGYVNDEVQEGDRPNIDEVTNQWSLGGTHYECHHAECVVVGTARFYFITEEEHLPCYHLPMVHLPSPGVRLPSPRRARCH